MRKGRATAVRSVLTVALAGLASACDGSNAPPEPAVEVLPVANSGDGQAGTVGQTLPARLRVRVTDHDRPLEGAEVAWSTPSGGTVAGAGATDVDGIVEAIWTLGHTAGTQNARAAVADATGSPVSFTATAQPGPAVRLLPRGVTSRDGQVGTVLFDPLEVIVRDQFENDVPGVSVTWAVEDGAAAVDPSTSITNAQGTATTTVTLPSTTQPSTITARVSGLVGSPTRFVATSRIYVSVDDDVFSPAELTVPAGTTVTWNWTGLGEHNVVPDEEEPVRSGDPIRTANKLYPHTFETPGTYRYYCQNHGLPGGHGMSGIIHVTP